MRKIVRAMLLSVVMLMSGTPARAGEEVTRANTLYRQGNYAAAISRLKALARKGNPFAQFTLAVAYDDGRGLPQDLARALSLYKAAAQSGLVDAQYMAGRFYGTGRGVKQDPARAFYWFNLAAAADYPRAAALRDLHRLQISPAQRHRMEERAVAWHATHPARLSCRFATCVYPRWLPRPRWTIFDPEEIRPR